MKQWIIKTPVKFTMKIIQVINSFEIHIQPVIKLKCQPIIPFMARYGNDRIIVSKIYIYFNFFRHPEYSVQEKAKLRKTEEYKMGLIKKDKW